MGKKKDRHQNKVDDQPLPKEETDDTSEHTVEDGEIVDEDDASPSNTEQPEVQDDPDRIREERMLRRKMKKERKKAERKAAAEATKDHSKKRKKRKHEKDHCDGDAEPQTEKKSKHESCDAVQDSCEGKPGWGKSGDSATKEEIQRWKAEKKLKVAKIMQLPKLFLTLREVFGRRVEKEGATIPPIHVSNIQQLVLYAMMGMKASVLPKWCQLLRWTKVSSVTVVVLSRVMQQHIDEYSSCFSNIQKLFRMSVPIQQTQSIEEEFLYLSLTKSKVKKLLELKGAKRDEMMQFVKRVDEDITDRTENSHKELRDDDDDDDDDSDRENGDSMDVDFKPDRRAYLLTEEQMQTHGYPLALDKKEKMISLNASETLEKHSPLFSIDCEMCLTKQGHELTRVSIVNEKHEVLYDTFVKPHNPIINYLTEYSGVTKEKLDPIKTRLTHVQKKLLSLLPPDAILVGQSLENDLKSLKLYHPHIIDTSVLFIGRNQHKIGLRNLAATYLKESIQSGSEGHDSIEDAITAMKLVQLKIDRGPSLKPYHSLGRKNVESIFSTIYRESLDGSMLDSINVLKQFSDEPVNSIPCLNDKEMIRKLPGAIQLGKFVWAQFHSMDTISEGITQDSRTISDTLQRLDERVLQVYESLPMKSLYLVLMTGEIDSSRVGADAGTASQLGRCYMTLKLPPLDRVSLDREASDPRS